MITGALQSTCSLVFGCWELNHVIYLKLRKKEQIHKMSIIFTQYVNLGPPGFENVTTSLNRAGCDGAEILKCVPSYIPYFLK